MLIEGFLTVIIVILFLLFIGFPLELILEWTGIIIIAATALASALFSLFFLFTSVSLLFFRKVKGRFVRFADDLRWDRAVYEAEGEEYTCIFPAETVGRRRIYQQKEYTLLISRSGKRRIAYDSHSLLIITLGVLTSAGFITLGAFIVSRLML